MHTCHCPPFLDSEEMNRWPCLEGKSLWKYADLFHIQDRISCLNTIRLPAASSVLVITTLSFGVQVPSMNRAQPRQLRIVFMFSYPE